METRAEYATETLSLIRDQDALVQMSQSEAREKTERIKAGLTEARHLLLEMYERRGWEALGYSSWREYGQIEFGYSESRIYQLMDAAKTERNISTIVEMPASIPEGQLRPLTRLEPEQQRDVWSQVEAENPSGHITAQKVQAIVDRYVPPESPSDNGSKPHVTHNSRNNEWCTPAEFVEAARQTMQAIDLDPASSEAANETVKATTYYTAENDGLQHDWSGRVWMNPPYSSDLVAPFCDKLLLHVSRGDVSEACVLVNNATETGWFQALLSASACACFPRSRIKFQDEHGNTAGTPLQGQAIVYIGACSADFETAFEDFGTILFTRSMDERLPF